MKRKQLEADFNEKKMNLSLKELEDEKENDERHMNVERFAFEFRSLFICLLNRVRTFCLTFRAPRNDFEDDTSEYMDVAILDKRNKERGAASGAASAAASSKGGRDG